MSVKLHTCKEMQSKTNFRSRTWELKESKGTQRRSSREAFAISSITPCLHSHQEFLHSPYRKILKSFHRPKPFYVIRLISPLITTDQAPSWTSSLKDLKNTSKVLSISRKSSISLKTSSPCPPIHYETLESPRIILIFLVFPPLTKQY